MANGFKVFATGEVLTASDVNDYLMEQSIAIFANSTARDAQITSPIEGQFCYLADSNVLQLYTSSWNNFIGDGDITAVTAGTALSGGGASGAVTLNVDVNGASSATPVSADEILIADVSASNATKKTTLNDLPVSSATQTALDAITAGTSTLTIPIEVKVADDGSGSQNVFYFLNGTDSGSGTRSVSMDLSTGFKYKFDISDSSNSGHPLKFSVTADGTHGGGSEFTTNVTTSGTAGSANAFVQVEITPETLGIAGATSTLYYYCPNHSGMGGSGLLSLLPSAGGGAGTAFDQLLLIGA
jgi:hypothetical protein